MADKVDASHSSEATSPEDGLKDFTVVFADLLIPGRGEPQHKAALVSDLEKIHYVGSQRELPKKYHQLNPIRVPVLMPGLWDCHEHLVGTTKMAGDSLLSLDPVVAGARCARDLAELLNAGYTSVRECGGHGVLLDQVVEEGMIAGPKIYGCGALISQTGGHGDYHGVRLPVWLDACDHGVPMHICDGPDACMRAVRLQMRAGARFIKICATGGVGSMLDDPEKRQYSDAELRAFVEEADRSGCIVAAHCHGKSGIMAALHAGIRTIEHGTYLDDESIQLMVEKGAILVPTRTIKEVLVQIAHTMNPQTQKKILKSEPVHKEAYRKAIAAGVTIALGADLGMSVPGGFASHGKNAMEIKHAVDLGMTPLQAIEAATANCPLTLGPQAPLSGQLKEGYDADFIALAKNPLENIAVVLDADNFTHVWRRGKLYKAPGKPVVPPAL